MTLANMLISRTRRLSLKTEGHTFALVPERIGVMEGLRAAVAIAVILSAAVALDCRDLTFGAVAVFWNCLCDPMGPTRARLKVMTTLSLMGAAVMVSASVIAHTGHIAGGAALFVLLTLCGLTRTYGPALGPVPAAPGLIASIAVVIGLISPRELSDALMMGGYFLLGSLWTIVLCIFIWHIPTQDTVSSTLLALFGRVEQMTAFLKSINGRSDRVAAQWQELDTLYRRGMRIAIERARETAGRLSLGYSQLDSGINAAGRVLAALIVVGECRRKADTTGGAQEDNQLVDGLHRLMLTLLRTMSETVPDMGQVARSGQQLLLSLSNRIDPLSLAIAYAAKAIVDFASRWDEQALTPPLKTNPVKASGLRLDPFVVRHALRVATAALLAYGTGAWLGVTLSFWGVIATIVITQPLTINTAARALERGLGTLIGAVIAGVLIAFHPLVPFIAIAIIPLSAAVIALRLVNYGLFIVFLTPMFMLMTELIRPSDGLVVARILNEFIGACVGIAASAVLWPEKESASMETAIAAAISSNMRFASAVLRCGKTSEPDMDVLHRQAGMASAALEAARERLIFEGRYRDPNVVRLQKIIVALRSICGAAVVMELLRDHSASESGDGRRADDLEALAQRLQATLANPAPAELVQLVSPVCDDLQRAVRDLAAAVTQYTGERRAASVESCAAS